MATVQDYGNGVYYVDRSGVEPIGLKISKLIKKERKSPKIVVPNIDDACCNVYTDGYYVIFERDFK